MTFILYISKPLQRYHWIIVALLTAVILLAALIYSECGKYLTITIVSMQGYEIHNDTLKLWQGTTRKPVEDLLVNEVMPNCGLPQQCMENTFPVHIYTGENKDDQPRICIRGKYYAGTMTVPSGRGINVVVLEPHPLQVINMKTFDTYQQDGQEMVSFLNEATHTGDILIFFTFDEASANLSETSKRALYELGSGKIQNLQFRSQWYMITQKGISGFTPFEVLNLSKNSKWAEPVDLRFCVPRKIRGQMISPDPPPRENIKRVLFCEKYNHYGNFCSVGSWNEPIIPAMLTQQGFVGNPTFTAPVLIMASEHRSSLLLTLESVIRQPGINPRHVVVIYRNGWKEAADLGALFGFLSLPVAPGHHWKWLEMGFEYCRSNFPMQKYVIVIEKGLMLSPDAFYYFAQMVPVLHKDRNVLAVSAWNPNGYETVSSNSQLAYRVEEFPGAAYMLPMNVYETYMKGKLNVCCNGSLWSGWQLNKESGAEEIIIPDVSRVLLRKLDYLDNTSISHAFLDRPRRVQLEQFSWMKEPLSLIEEKYLHDLGMLFSSSLPIHISQNMLETCNVGQGIKITEGLNSTSGQNFSLFYKENVTGENSKLNLLCKCFGLYYGHRPYGLYRGMLRFTVNKNNVFLVSSKSPFYKYKPKDYPAA